MQQGEEWTRLLAPKASEENGHEVYDHTMVVDLKQLSLKRFRKWDKAYMGNFAKVMSDYTPEVLYKCFLVNAPKIMSAAWAVVEPFLDQRTRQKIGARSTSHPPAQTSNLLCIC